MNWYRVGLKFMYALPFVVLGAFVIWGLYEAAGFAVSVAIVSALYGAYAYICLTLWLERKVEEQIPPPKDS